MNTERYYAEYVYDNGWVVFDKQLGPLAVLDTKHVVGRLNNYEKALSEIMAMTHQRSNWTLGEIKAVAEEALR